MIAPSHIFSCKKIFKIIFYIKRLEKSDNTKKISFNLTLISNFSTNSTIDFVTFGEFLSSRRDPVFLYETNVNYIMIFLLIRYLFKLYILTKNGEEKWNSETSFGFPQKISNENFNNCKIKTRDYNNDNFDDLIIMNASAKNFRFLMNPYVYFS